VPTYQYACTESACGHRFDAVQSFSDDPLTSCPVCEGRVRKVFSAVGVVFKGSGFYRTDSRQAAAGAKDGKSGKDGGKDGGTAEKKAESSSSSASSSSSSSGSGASAGSGSSGSTSKAAAS
jgi:putative FmdB family regulatory protein